MSSFYDDASLVVIPSGYKTSKVYAEKPTDGSGDLTFTRTGDTATRVNSAGLIEKVRTNLFLQSQTFDNASWAKSNITVTANTTVAPDGTTTADTFVSLGVTSEHAVRATTSMAVNTEHTASVYVKQTNTRYAYIRDLTNNAVAIYDLQDGVVSLAAGTSTSITAVGSFYRISMTFVTPAVIVNNLIDLGITTSPSSLSSLVPVNDTMVFWAAQLETGVATPYIPTTTAAVSVGPTANTARLDYLGSTCPRLLLEPQRQNICLWSEQINNAAWGQSLLGGTLTLTPNYGISPDGYQNADRIQMSVTTGYSDIVQVVSTSSGTAYTYSVYLKSLSGTPTIAFLNDGTANRLVTLTTDWQRYTFTISSAGSLVYPRFLCENGVTSSSADFLAWGAQLEQGAYSTSLIPTLAASATRGADACSKTGISSLIGQTQGTLFAEINVPSIASAGTYANFALNDGTSSNAVDFTYYPDGRIQATAFVGGSITVNINLTSYGLTAGNHKIAFAYKLNDYVLYVDGTQAGADTSSAVPAMSKFDLYLGSGSTQVYNQALLFKTRLTNSELAELTSL